MTTSAPASSKPAFEHHVDGGFGLGDVQSHDDAFARGEAIGLDDDGRALRARIGLGRRSGAEAFIGRGRDAVRLAQILGEALGAFEPRGRLGRAEGLDAGGFEVVDDAGAQRRLGPDHDEIDAVSAAKGDHSRMVGEIERDALRLLRDAGIAGRAEQPVGERARGHFPGQRVLAPAGAENEDVHAVGTLFSVPGLAWRNGGASDGRGLDRPQRCTTLASKAVAETMFAAHSWRLR